MPADSRFEFGTGFVDCGALVSKGCCWEEVFRVCLLATSHVRELLTIQLSGKANPEIGECRDLVKYCECIYSQCMSTVKKSNNLSLNIVVRFGDGEVPQDAVVFISGRFSPDTSSCREQVSMAESIAIPLLPRVYPAPLTRSFCRTLFAGTFDHLHAGHKSVLTQVLLCTDHEIYIGITSDSMLTSKQFPLVIQPFEVRKQNVISFLSGVIPACLKGLIITVLEIHDPIGPAKSLDFDALVVTPETKRGGELVNQARIESGHPAVGILEIGILSGETVQNKLSSTALRQNVVSHLPGGYDELRKMYDDWSRMCKSLDVSHVVARRWWSRLIDMYALEGWRYYHTVLHVSELLQMSRSFAGSGPACEMILSIFFHDAVYNPRSTSNETDSELLFGEFAREAEISESVISGVSEAILATRNHRSALESGILPETPDWVPIFLEMDLAILAAPTSRYATYMQQIRDEYSFVSTADFARKRSEFLIGLKTFRFHWQSGAAEYTDRMIQNIERELSTLAQL